MKPIHLNLAARPYRDYRPVYAVVVVVSLFTAFLMLQNIDTYYRYTHATRNTRDQIATIERQTAAEHKRAEIVERRLAALDLKLLDDQTKFVNTKLRERAFSWSVLLDELETILPQDVRILSISPGFTPTGVVNLGLSFESKSSQGMIKTLNNLQSDPQFANPFPGSEVNTAGIFAFNVNVQYFPPAMPTRPAVTPVKAVAR